MEQSDPTQNGTDIKDPFAEEIAPIPRKLEAGLYLVATPIGNLRDITLRALDILGSADLIACEDTRMTGKLLSLLGFPKKKLFPYHDHNADKERPHLIEKIEKGAAIALVSDAGMPLISDPGYKLVRDCAEKNLYVTSLPGANAPLTALQLSGLPSDTFTFLGFLPQKTKARQKDLEDWKDSQSTLILFESATRIESCCKDIKTVLGNRPVALVRELTKKFEEVWRGPITEIIARLENGETPKGEIVLVIGAADKQKPIAESDLDKSLHDALETLSFKESVEVVTHQTGLPKKQVYARALELKKERA